MTTTPTPNETEIEEPSFDSYFVHYFPKAEGEIVQEGDIALCGVISTSTRNANNKEKIEGVRCPLCLAVFED